MDWNALLMAAGGLAASIGGSGLLSLRSDRKLKGLEVRLRQADVERSQADEWKRLYDASEAERKELGAKLDKLYDERKELLGQVLDRDRQLARKDIELTSLNFARCHVQHCRRRKPPREYEFETEPEINFENETNEKDIQDNPVPPVAAPAAGPRAGLQGGGGTAPVGRGDRAGDGNPA